MERAKNFAEAVKAARERRQWTQDEAAAAVDVDANTWYRWEKGKAMPRGQNLRNVCEKLGITLTKPRREIKEVEAPPAIQAFIESDPTMCLMVLASVEHPSHQILQDRISQILEEHHMTENSMPRRQALRQLATFPFIPMFGMASQPNIEDTLSRCAASIAACRELTRGSEYSDLALAFEITSAYLPILKAIMKDSSRHRKAAANLAAQCAHLQTVLGWHLEDRQRAVLHAQDAAFYAREADDPALLASALIYQSWSQYYDHQGRAAIDAISQAVPLLKYGDLPKSLSARIYSTQAVMEAKGGLESIGSLRLAHRALQAMPTSEYYASSEYLVPEMIGNEAMVYYHVGNYQKAMDIFGQLIDQETLASKQSLSGRARAEMLGLMTMTSLKQPKKDMDTTLRFWKADVKEANALQSRQRRAEALAAYDIMEVLWPDESRIKDLRERIVHW